MPIFASPKAKSISASLIFPIRRIWNLSLAWQVVAISTPTRCRRITWGVFPLGPMPCRPDGGSLISTVYPTRRPGSDSVWQRQHHVGSIILGRIHARRYLIGPHHVGGIGPHQLAPVIDAGRVIDP